MTAQIRNKIMTTQIRNVGLYAIHKKEKRKRKKKKKPTKTKPKTSF